jgi:putative oxidoreductase
MSTTTFESTTAARTQATAATDWALLILRVILGVTFMIHGSQKMFGAFGGPGLAGVVKMMGPVGYLVAIGEFFGGLGILVGFLTRFSGAAITLIMLGAIFMVHLKNGFFMNWMGSQKGEGFEFHLLVIAMALALAIAGPGLLNLGRILPLPKQANSGNLAKGIE